jgi:hypothetical protein
MQELEDKDKNYQAGKRECSMTRTQSRKFSDECLELAYVGRGFQVPSLLRKISGCLEDRWWDTALDRCNDVFNVDKRSHSRYTKSAANLCRRIARAIN